MYAYFSNDDGKEVTFIKRLMPPCRILLYLHATYPTERKMRMTTVWLVSVEENIFALELFFELFCMFAAICFVATPRYTDTDR